MRDFLTALAVGTGIGGLTLAVAAFGSIVVWRRRNRRRKASLMPDGTTPLFCGASNDEDFNTMAECRRKHGHKAHHCDTTKQLAWDGDGPVDCPALYDHGAPPNRATRRATVRRRPRHLARIRRNDGRNV